MCLHDPIFKTDKESSIWRQNDHRDIMQNLSAPFIFHEECRMKMEHVLFPFVFSKLRIRVGRSFSMCCSHDPIFGTNKNRVLKNGSCERDLRLLVFENLIQFPKQRYLSSDKWHSNDKPADGFQQNCKSKPKTLSCEFYRKLC